jgi:hypothetical protein
MSQIRSAQQDESEERECRDCAIDSDQTFDGGLDTDPQG